MQLAVLRAVTISAALPRGTLRASDAEEGAQGHTAGRWDLDLGRAGHLGWMSGEFRAHCLRHGVITGQSLPQDKSRPAVQLSASCTPERPGQA